MLSADSIYFAITSCAWWHLNQISLRVQEIGFKSQWFACKRSYYPYRICFKLYAYSGSIICFRIFRKDECIWLSINNVVLEFGHPRTRSVLLIHRCILNLPILWSKVIWDQRDLCFTLLCSYLVEREWLDYHGYKISIWFLWG